LGELIFKKKEVKLRQSKFTGVYSTKITIKLKFFRGGCDLGMIPANGLIFSFPEVCGCFSQNIHGFMA